MPGLVPGIHIFVSASKEDVDGRDKPGHDDEWRVFLLKASVQTPNAYSFSPAFQA
jgi:hypothetical protein